jgi:iron complex transport system ATP-binding protein
MTQLVLNNLSLDRKQVAILRNVTLEIEESQFVSLVGPNGAGKTSLLRSILGFEPDVKGEIKICSVPLQSYSQSALARVVGYIPQRFTVAFPFTVGEFLGMSLYTHQEIDLEEKQRMVDEASALTGIESLTKRALTTLSGGEMQKVMLAAALVHRPKLLLLDEAGASLDPRHSTEMQQLIDQLRRKRALTVLAVTHDVNSAAQYSNRVIGLRQGRVIFDGSPADFLKEGALERIFETGFERFVNPSDSRVIALPRS